MISENVLPPRLIGSELIQSSKNLTRRRRQEPINAEQFLDQEINYLIQTAYDVIDQGIKKTEAHQRVKVDEHLFFCTNKASYSGPCNKVATVEKNDSWVIL